MKAARALVGWSQKILAEHSGVSLPTIKRLESKEGPLGGLEETANKLVSCLEEAGVIFIHENGEGAGVRLRKKP